MVHLQYCPCLNLTFHLKEPVVKADSSTYGWVVEKTRMKELSVGTISPLAGVQVQVKELVQYRQVANEWKNWKCCRCLGCGHDIFLSNSTAPETILLNDTVIISKRPMEISSVFGIVLDDPYGSANRVLDSPNDEEIEMFDRLQQKVQTFLNEQEKNMNRRIAEYAQLQQDNFMILQSAAYRERKILWHKIWRARHSSLTKDHDAIKPSHQRLRSVSDSSKLARTLSSVETKPTQSSTDPDIGDSVLNTKELPNRMSSSLPKPDTQVNLKAASDGIDSLENGGAEPGTTSNEASPSTGSTWKTHSTLPNKKSLALGVQRNVVEEDIFDFDGEKDKKHTLPKFLEFSLDTTLTDSDDEDGSEESSVIKENYGEQLVPSSLPVTIPPKFANWGSERPKNVSFPKMSLQEATTMSSTTTTTTTNTTSTTSTTKTNKDRANSKANPFLVHYDNNDILSSSFAVPQSLTQRMIDLKT